jgi:predicted AAA+ superfamily ATPase
MVSKIQQDLDEALEDLANAMDTIEHVTAVEQDGAHIPIDWHEIGGIRVGLDAAGNAVRVEFGDTLPGWVAE